MSFTICTSKLLQLFARAIPRTGTGLTILCLCGLLCIDNAVSVYQTFKTEAGRNLGPLKLKIAAMFFGFVFFKTPLS